MRNNLRLSVLSWLAFTVQGIHSENVNVTVDDSDSSILYQPSNSWFANSDGCANCLHPMASLALNDTYHFGMHNISITVEDADSNSADTASTPTSITTSHGILSGQDSDDTRKDHKNDDDNDGRARRRRDILPRLDSDSDDSGFSDPTVSVQFSFTGFAIYVFCVEPLALSSSSSLTTMNLSFTLDNTPSGTFFHDGSSSTSGFAPNVPVITLENLNEDPHILLVNVEPNSVFAFDYMIYSTNLQPTSSVSSTSITATAVPSLSPQTRKESESTSHRNVATFGGAVGGSAGVLGTLALCIFLSIWVRRCRSANREKRERELGPTDDVPSTIGPAPFVPRFFPRVGSPAPPPYTAPSRTVHTQTSSFHTFTPHPVADSSPPPLYHDPPHQELAGSLVLLPYASIPLSTPPGLSTVPQIVCSSPPPFGEVVASSGLISSVDVITVSRDREISEMQPTNSSRAPSVQIDAAPSTSQQHTDMETEDHYSPTPPGPDELSHPSLAIAAELLSTDSSQEAVEDTGQLDDGGASVAIIGSSPVDS